MELGLEPKTADMLYFDWKPKRDIPDIGSIEKDVVENKKYLCTPCWSLGALISILPCFIKEGENEYCLSISPDGAGNWIVDYSTFETRECFMDYIDESLLNALYYMCCFLLERNYIKK